MRRPARSSVLLLSVAVVVSALVVAVALFVDPFGDDDPAGPDQDTFTTTPLADVDTLALTVPREPFCPEIDPREVAAALGAEPDSDRGYDNGDQVTLTAGVTDVAHEFGCVWALDDGSEARAWVFAPPVGADRAASLIEGASRADGCEAATSPAYGAPSVGLVCTGDEGTRASYRGLFGDAWLSCELTSTDSAVDTVELRERAGDWCSGVARGASS